jgi:hypothetical protein
LGKNSNFTYHVIFGCSLVICLRLREMRGKELHAPP